MSTDRDVERIVRSWMDEGVTALPDRVLDAVLDQLPATPQRRAGWLARRFPIMNNNLVRLGMSAAVLVLAAIVGIKLLVGPNVGGPTQTPVPAPTPTPQTIPHEGERPGPQLAAGTYRIPGQGSEEMVATLPAGWYRNTDSLGGGLFRGSPLSDLFSQDARLSITSVDRLVSEPCTDVPGAPVSAVEPPIGPTVEDLVDALQVLAGVSVSAPVDITIDGYQGKQIELTYLRGTEACGWYLLWTTPPFFNESWNASIQAGWSSTLRILDVGGRRWVVLTSYRLDVRSEIQVELERIADSIELP